MNYIDDCFSSSSELNEFEKLKRESNELLKKGQISLYKWCSNKDQILELKEFSLERNSEEIIIKILGILRNNLTDNFHI